MPEDDINAIVFATLEVLQLRGMIVRKLCGDCNQKEIRKLQLAEQIARNMKSIAVSVELWEQLKK